MSLNTNVPRRELILTFPTVRWDRPRRMITNTKCCVRVIYVHCFLPIFLSVVLLESAAQSIPAKARDPFIAYLTGKPPAIVDHLASEVHGDVRIEKIVFHSRDVKTPEGFSPTHVFAVIARPVRPGRYPGLLILHGGGGAAETDKAIRWADRGYIVVTLDIPGIANPEKVPFSTGLWKSLRYGEQRFTARPDITQSTIFEGVVAALRGLYLLHAQPDVIRNRVGITGISWGGYMTTMVSGLAYRYVNASFSTYGCGYYDAGTLFMKNLGKMPEIDRETWLAYLDAGRRAKNISHPFFIAAATNDNWFYPPAVMKTLHACEGPVNHLFAPNANHQAPVPGGTGVKSSAGWLKMEELYFDFYLKESGFPFLKVNIETGRKMRTRSDTDAMVRFSVDGKVPVASADVYYATSDTLWTKLQWKKVSARRVRNHIYEAELPLKAIGKDVYWFASVSDDRAVTVSSDIVYFEMEDQGVRMKPKKRYDK